MSEATEELGPASPEVIARLVASHREFLAFLERRLPDRATAEEILQAAFVRTLERGEAIRESESAVAWFYRVLRNALIDHYRRRSTEKNGAERLSLEPTLPNELEVKEVACRCYELLLPNLKPEYAQVLRQADLEEQPIAQIAEGLSITPNNATVRLHRARQALRKQLERSCGSCATHGCLDCSCQRHPQPD